MLQVYNKSKELYTTTEHSCFPAVPVFVCIQKETGVGYFQDFLVGTVDPSHL